MSPFDRRLLEAPSRYARDERPITHVVSSLPLKLKVVSSSQSLASGGALFPVRITQAVFRAVFESGLASTRIPEALLSSVLTAWVVPGAPRWLGVHSSTAAYRRGALRIHAACIAV